MIFVRFVAKNLRRAGFGSAFGHVEYSRAVFADDYFVALFYVELDLRPQLHVAGTACSVDNLGDGDAVVIDNRHAARTTTEHLLSLGHRRIALVIDETDWTTGRERRQGYAEALAAAGIDVDERLIVSAGWHAETAEHVARTLLSAADRPSAVFAANNLLAEGVWRAAADLKLRVPGDLSLVAFDDAPWMSMVTPGVTAVTQDAARLGAEAVTLLLDRIADPERDDRVVSISAGFVRRDSTSRPAF